MNNTDLWVSIDNFAADQGLTCAGLAKRCGLNATIFNKSKRTSKHKQQRWLSTGALAKILAKYNIDIHDYVNKYIPRHNKEDEQNEQID